MITRIGASNFLSIGPNGIDCPVKPLTFILGKNGAGKSNLATIPLLFGQYTRIEPLQSTPVLHVNKGLGYLRFGQLSDFWFRRETHNPLYVSLTVKLPKAALDRMPSEYEQYWPERQDLVEVTWRFSSQIARGNLTLYGHELLVGGRPLIGVETIPTGGGYGSQFSIKGKPITEFLPAPDARLESLYEFNFRVPPNVGSTKAGAKGTPEKVGDAACWFAREFLDAVWGHVLFISAQRGHIPTGASTSNDPWYVGVNGQFLIEMLSKLTSDPGGIEKWNEIQVWAQRFGLSKVTAGFHGAQKLRGGFVDSETGASLDLYQASAGSAQLLSVIAQIVMMPSGSVLILEEPETSLHVKAQLVLSELLAWGVGRKHAQIIVTTHSEPLLLGLQGPLEKGVIAGDDIAAIEAVKNKNGTSCNVLSLVKNGQVGGAIPSLDSTYSDLFDLYFPRKKRSRS